MGILRKIMALTDKKRDGPPEQFLNGPVIRWRKDRTASCGLGMIGAMFLFCFTYLCYRELSYLFQHHGPGLIQGVLHQYCEDYVDKVIVDRGSLWPEPIENIPLKDRGLVGKTYNPEDDPLVKFDESGVNSIESFPDADRVFYNRVAKCGSRTVMRILEKLEKLNNFTIYKSKVYDKMKLQLDEQAEFVDEIMRVPAPVLIDRHIHFLDFEAMGVAQPLYFNVIRDPVDRAVSTFYFKQNNLTSPEEASKIKIKSFEECVYKKKEGCTGRHVFMKMLYYFCGQDPRCWFDRSRSWTLARAKRVAVKYYAVVGIVEDMDSFFYALEKRLPRFFRGAFGLYGRHGANLKEAYRTRGKIYPSEEVRKIMKENMPESFEFYYFIKQRFHNMLDQLMEGAT